MKKIIKLDDCTVSYEETDEIKQKVFDRVIEYYQKHKSFFGEVICQSDDPVIDAPIVLSDIADDIIKFDMQDND